MSPRDRIGASVREFYDRMPFNYYSTTSVATARLRTNPLPSACPDLHRLLTSGEIQSVLDFGCGTGWLANLIAHHYRIPATGVDFTARAIVRARSVSRSLGTTGLASFVVADLFAYDAAAPVDLVTAVGVLHHTRSAQAGFQRIQRFAAPGKYVYLGLYHRYGRKPFLDLFADILAREGEAAAYRRYAELDTTRRADAAHRRSWFRDQVLHPHESSHTLAETAGWLATAGFRVESTSINGFAPLGKIEHLFEGEKQYEDVSRRANLVERRYFPGFFTVLARRIPKA